MNATEAYGLTLEGRCDVDGVEYVAYYDGAHSYAVLAADYDDVRGADDYQLWCSNTGGIDRGTSAAVARKVGLDGIYSSDGLNTWVDANSVPCESGEWFGKPCGDAGLPEHMATVEYMPQHLRASHDASRNCGCWPANGARRITCCDWCATRIVKQDEWASIVD